MLICIWDNWRYLPIALARLLPSFPDLFLPGFGNTDLAQFALLFLDQVQGLVELTLGAATVGLAALAGAGIQSTAKEPVARSQLSDAGAETTFCGRQIGTRDHGDNDKGPIHPYITTSYKILRRRSGENAMRK